LIYLALREWLHKESRVLLLDPTYGEYAHVCEHVVGCAVERLALRRDKSYRVNLRDLEKAFARDYDMIVVVNPNNPTGQMIPSGALVDVLCRLPQRTRCWIDEAYLEFTSQPSLEPFAAESRNIVVSKSLSKVYALSGARAAYLVGHPEIVSQLRRLTPPWAVSLLAQVAAVRALESPGYYVERYAETSRLRTELCRGIKEIDAEIEVVDGVGNFVLFHLPEGGPNAAELVARCRRRGLYLRDAGVTSPALGRFALRAAVKDRPTQQRVLEILSEGLSAP
jgi:histidinol-phosphate/aromatic aminotransferase/cobyric acid decarboxylase-like protein